MFGMCLFLFAACSYRQTAVDFSRIALEEGDLVFRRGIGVKSQAVLSADTAGIYSHSGIVVRLDSGYRIIHVTSGEREKGEKEDRIKIESPETFFAADRAEHGAVYRIKEARNYAAEAASHAKRLLEKGVLFDHDYVLEDTTQLYCTELVWYVYQLAGKDITNGKRSELNNFPLFSGVYIFPSDLYGNNEFNLIYKF
jgi:hypothetical protein